MPIPLQTWIATVLQFAHLIILVKKTALHYSKNTTSVEDKDVLQKTFHYCILEPNAGVNAQILFQTSTGMHTTVISNLKEMQPQKFIFFLFTV